MEHGEERLPAKALLELLPPIEDAPILEHLARVGLAKFQEEYALPTPQDENGLIDYKEFTDVTTGLVTNKDYQWDGSSWNVHHLFYYKRRFVASRFNGDNYPYDFRELTTNKIYEPKQKHIFDHTVTRPPFVPSLETMHQAVDEFNSASRVYELLGNAAVFALQLDAAGVRRTSRVYDRIERHIQTGLYPYIGELVEGDSIDRQAIEYSLSVLRAHVGELIGKVGSRRNAMFVNVPTRHR